MVVAILVEFTGELAYTKPLKWIMLGNLMAVTLRVLVFAKLIEVVVLLIEIDKLKTYNNTLKYLVPNDRRTPWSTVSTFVVAVMTMAPYADNGVDITHVTQMALVHDIIEIDAGDDMLIYALKGDTAAVHVANDTVASSIS